MKNYLDVIVSRIQSVRLFLKVYSVLLKRTETWNTSFPFWHKCTKLLVSVHNVITVIST